MFTAGGIIGYIIGFVGGVIVTSIAAHYKPTWFNSQVQWVVDKVKNI